MATKTLFALVTVILVVLGISQLVLLNFWTAIEDLSFELAETRRALRKEQEKSQLQQQGLSQTAELPNPSSFLGVNPALLQRKLFSSALQPFALKPFYHRASKFSGGGNGVIRVSLTTMVTVERQQKLPLLAEMWGGHMSVAYRIKADPTITPLTANGPLQAQLQKLDLLLRQFPELAELADIHLVIDELPLQFNLWRNIARLFSPAQSVVMLDADFIPNAHLRIFITRHWDALFEKMTTEKAAFVIPAFEVTGEAAAPSPSFPSPPSFRLPSSKAEAVDRVRRGELEMFHSSWYHGQGHTNYTRWLAIPSSSVQQGGGDRSNKGDAEGDLALIYPVETYHFKYEPYVLIPQDAPFCDERFLGYGSNKCACIYELKAAGYSFHVLPDSFVIHRPHPSDNGREGTRAREKENELNFETMKRFMKDMELKYGLRAPKANQL